MLAEELPAALSRKGVLMVRDGRSAGVLGPDHFDYVEPGRILQKTVRLEEGRRRTGHSLPAVMIDGQCRTRAGLVTAGLHFDEDDRLAVDGDHVDLAVAQPAARGDDAVLAPAPEIAGGAPLALLAEREWAEAVYEPMLQAHGWP